MRVDDKRKIVSVAVVIGIVAIAFLLVLNLNLLSWPLGTVVQEQVPNQNATIQTVSYGFLLVTVRENSLRISPSSMTSTTIASNQTQSPVDHPNLDGYLAFSSNNIPMQGIGVTITSLDSGRQLSTRMTDSNGQIEIYLPPAQYRVTVRGSVLSNLSVVLQVFGSKTTRLDVQLNRTDYTIASYDFLDSDSSSSIGSWEKAFVMVPTTNPIQNQGASVFLEAFYESSCVLCSSIAASEAVPVTITSRSASIGSQWLELQVLGVLSLAGVHNMMLEVDRTSYVVTVGSE